ncbi:MAG TPA: segregation/condensation protein A [Clostridia bacterium]|nr:segregation/condensation protein A [Clostridia bacterium]
MKKITYKLDGFEGPMDLLLHLISKHKLDINDIPIFDLIEQYLGYVKQMNNDNMDVASEFLEMAARLVYIKTLSLLPVHEEADKLAEELRGELTEYRDCKLVAGKLSEQADGFDYLSRKPLEIEPDMTYTRRHEPSELFKAFISAVGKGRRKLPPPVEVFSGIIAHKIVSVASRVSFVLKRIFNKSRQSFAELFESSESRSEMVATFLAVLALVKAKRITVNGDTENPEIRIQSNKEEWTDIESE